MTLLTKYAAIFNSSLMQDYPESVAHYPAEFSTLKQDLTSLQQFCDGIDEAPVQREPESANFRPSLTSTVTKISDKKHHELQVLLALLQYHTQRESPSLPVVDWGGGKGHLGALVQAETEHPVLILEKDPDFQSHYADLQYLEAMVELHRPLPTSLAKQLSLDHGSLGLHACGSLSIAQLENAIAYPCQWLINIPCCFEKMRESHRPLSNTLKHLTPLSHAALNLATRTSKDTSEDNARLKANIHDFRWTIFLFEHEVLLPQKKISRVTQKLGRFSKANYRQGFSTYLREVLKRLPHLGDYESELFAFFQQEETQNLLARTHQLQNWRNAFARPLELAVVLDRGFWLQEQGFEVHVERLFNDQISPRNFAIRAHRSRV